MVRALCRMLCALCCEHFMYMTRQGDSRNTIVLSQTKQLCAHPPFRKKRAVSLAAIGSRTSLVAERSARRAADVPSHPAVISVPGAKQRFHKDFMFQTRAAGVGLAVEPPPFFSQTDTFVVTSSPSPS
jgi:hypothetical protein